MAQLYSNENFPLPVVQRLRQLGHNVLTIQETGKAEQSMPDEAVLLYAISEQRALVTLNRKHFIQLHKEKPYHYGIIVCSFDPDFIGQADRIHESVQSEEPLLGKLIRVNRVS
ncbi:MAG: DUF5615 family PIN-like protein [Candidatus Omnitrophota bacterium]